MGTKGYTVKIHTDYVIQDQYEISKILERIGKIVSASYARQTRQNT